MTLLPDLPYDPEKDFTPITMMELSKRSGRARNFTGKTTQELVALAKSKPGGVNYASQGIGSGGHLLGTMFQNAVGIPMTNVPVPAARVRRCRMLSAAGSI